MALTRRFNISADAQVLSSLPTTNYGSGTVLFLGLAPASSAIGRSLLRFGLDWTDVSSIVSIRLYIHTASTVGPSPNFNINRNSSSFSESSVTWNTQPGITGSTVNTSIGSAANTWYSVDITSVAQPWAPSTLGGSAATNYGIALRSSNEGDNTNYTRFSTRETAYDAYLILTYTSDSAPNAPTLTSPANGAFQSSQTPTLTFTHTDPESDPLYSYDIQVANDTAFSSIAWSVTDSTTGISGNNVSRAVGTSLTRGNTYYWRARTRQDNASGLKGAWSGYRSFKVGVLPTVTLQQPEATALAELYFDAGGSGNPKMAVRWAFSCLDGHQQQSMLVKIYDSAGGSVLNGGGSGETVTGTQAYLRSTYAVANGTQYRVSLTPVCSAGVTGAESPGSGASARLTRTRWARASYFVDTTLSPPANVSVDHTETPASNGKSKLILEYTMTGSTAEPSSWSGSLADASPARYLWHRATMWSWGASPATHALDSLTWSYFSSGAIVLDSWTLAGAGSIDTANGAFIFGSQGLKHTGSGTSWQLINVTQDRDYILSGFMRSLGNSGAKIEVASASSGGVVYATTAALAATADWDRYIATAAFNSGSNSQVYVRCTTTAGTAWFDSVKLELGTSATPWTPGLSANTVVLDAGGIMVNGLAGGVFRLQGSSASSDRDRVDLGAKGLVFGGTTSPVQLSSDIANQLLADGAILSKRSSLGTSWFAGNQSGDADHRMRMGSLGPSNKAALMLGDGAAAPNDGIYWNADNDLRVTDADINMLWRQMVVLGPFFVSNLAAGTTVDLDLANLVTTGARTRIPWSCDIVGISVRSSAAVTAGTVTFKPTIGGVAGTLSAQLNTTDTQNKTATQGLGIDDATTTDVVGVTVTSSAGFTPAGSVEFVVFLYLALVKS